MMYFCDFTCCLELQLTIDWLTRDLYLYSGTSLIWTPMGQKKASLLVRCPHFRGLNACKSGTWGGERCPV